jgi:Flp pilus assembly protein TadD
VLVVALTYANSLAGPFVLDDQAAIVTNRDIRDLSQPSRVLLPAPESPAAGRPLANLSFAVNYAIGGLDVRGYRLVNLGLHAACALLIFGVARRTLEGTWGPELHGRATSIAMAAALLWAVHPLNSEVVNYLSQRTESLMAMCLLTALYSAIRAHTSGRPLWEAASVAACALGMMSKESMAIAPIVIALYDRVFLFGSWREAFTKRRRVYAGLAATWLILGALIAGAPRSSVAGFATGVAVWTNLLNQAVMITHYLRLSVWPTDLVAFYGWHLPLTLGDVLPHALLIVSLVAATGIALVRTPWLGFLGMWFFMTLAPSSSIVPIATEVGAERRMYLPLVAVVMLGVIGVWLLWTRVSRGRAALVPFVSVVVVAAALAFTTGLRNREYSSALTLAQTIVERRPTGVSWHIFAEALQRAERERESVPPLREAIAAGNSRAGYALGVALFNQGQYPEAIDRLDAFVKTEGQHLVPRWLEPPTVDVVASRLLMGKAFLAQGDGDRAVQQAETVLTAYPRHVEARGLLADARYGQRRWPEAAAAYRIYLAARPQDVAALMGFGVSSIATGDFDVAIGAFERAVLIEPGNERAQRLLTLALQDRAENTSSR